MTTHWCLGVRNWNRNLLSIAISLISLHFFTALSYAAETATLSGIVRDPSDAAIVQAEVLIRDQSTGAERHAWTNSAGLFTAPALQASVYTIAITARGFKELRSVDIRLGVAEVKQIDFTMELGDVAQTISVDSSAPAVNTSDGSVGMTLDQQLISALPINGRSFQQLITQAPGITLTPSTSMGGQFTANGQRPTTNYLSIDGASGNFGSSLLSDGGTLFPGNAAGGTNSLVSVDAIEEFRILTSTFSPEFGRTPGAQVVVRTRSGTNLFHAAAFEYFRNDVLDANDWFANANGRSHAPLRFNDFGGVLGGPLLRNKTFFFLSYEQQQINQPQFTLSVVPSLDIRQSAPPQVRPLLDAYPLPNGPSLGNGQSQLAAGYSIPLSTHAVSLRLDHTFTPSLMAFARYNYAPSDQANRGSFGNYALSTVSQQSNKTQTLTGGLTYLVSPSVVDDLRINLSDNSAGSQWTLDNFMGAVPPPPALIFPTGFSPTKSLFNLSLGFTSGSLYEGTSSFSEQRQINVIDSLAVTKGLHQLKFGADYRRLLPLLSPLYNIAYKFAGIPSVVANTPSSVRNTFQPGVRGSISNVSLYAQDTWRIRPNLTATYGIRWDLTTPPTSLRAHNGNYVPLTGDFSDPSSIQIGAVGSSLWTTKYTNLAPRLGLAYTLNPLSAHPLTLRIGVGLFFDLGDGAAAIYPFNNGFPNALSSTVSGVTFPAEASQLALPVVNVTNPPPGQTFYVYPRDLALPRVWQWSVAIQQSIDRKSSVTASYVAAVGRKLLYQQSYQLVGPRAYSIVYSDNEGRSNYQAFQFQYQRQLTQGLTVNGSYAWGHSLDNVSNDYASLPPSSYVGANANWASSDFDVRHAVSGAVSYDIPSGGPSWLQPVLRGWGLNGVLTARSAMPVDVVTTENIGYGSFSFRPDLVPGSPLYLKDPNVAGGVRINPGAFSVVTTRQGDLGRNALRGFDLVQVDVGVRRSVRLSERVTLTLRGDLFNILNHPNFASQVNVLGTGTFGLSPSMANASLGGANGNGGLNSLFQEGGPRSAQLSLRLAF